MNHTILAIETSCDETAAAVYNTADGCLSNKLFSQIDLHTVFGGVVPEVASRSHMEKIGVIIQEALDAAGKTLDTIDAIAVTHKPGLPGSLLVGVCFAKGLALATNKPLYGIDHLEGHAFSAQIEHTIPLPYLCITASGGHTSLYIINGLGDYETLGTTLDDAAGEAFDKISKMLELGYPGGPVIEKLAREIECKDVYSYPRNNPELGYNFSFSGLKTAVLYNLVKQDAYDLKKKKLLNSSYTLKQKVASSLLVCIKDVFIQKLSYAFAKNPHIKSIAFVGGVACNTFIRKELKEWAEARGLSFFVPSPQYCTDNAGMIAHVADYKIRLNQVASGLDLDILR